MTAPSAIAPEITMHLPPVYLPMPLLSHPQLDLLEQRGIAWMAQHGFCDDPALRKRIIDSMGAHFYGYVCPAADTDRLQMAVDWAYLMFLFDDVHGDSAQTDADGDNYAFLDLAVRIVRTLETPTARILDSRHPFTAPIVDLATRLHRCTSPVQLRRLADAHALWLLGVAWEIPASRHPATSLDDYLCTRHMYAAAAPTITWLQITDPEPIDDTEITHPRVRALTEMAGTVAAIDDDLYGYGKDQWLARRHSGPAMAPANLIDVYTTQDQLSPDTALHACVALRDRIVHRFLQVRDQVTPEASPALTRYLHNLTCLMRGNYEYGLAAARYTNPDGLHPGAVHITGSTTDTPAAVGPPGIPGIDWWWAP
ncbi:terpene synthase family protein [Actinomadura rubrisoli]|uniref:Glutamate dehydrogenase n=1 Tax=Actinomadura rubrisoli TaxID=2530368 RepID=A0A4R5CED4_9ACTN|nr:glutamate dehydrogenase [Actinomadura rubrisoli]TDD96710.1 glutamate dehydrogenase [Actinomadura rubrisoli]